MNDRFKFRVWDSTTHRMLYTEKKDFILQNDVVLIREYATDIYNPDPCLDTNYLMQCTGKKDKNDKLIFEGDILEWEVNNHARAKLRVVVAWNDEYQGYNITDMNLSKVIGNIYENPELLELQC